MSQVSPSVVATWVASHGDIASNHGFNISFLVGGWALPLWKMMEWVRQLGWWHFQLNGKNNPFMFQSPPTRYIIHWYSLVISHICIYNYIYIYVISLVNINGLYIWLVVTGTWMDYFFHSVGNVIIPTDELTPSFFRGVGLNHQQEKIYWIRDCWRYLHEKPLM